MPTKLRTDIYGELIVQRRDMDAGDVVPMHDHTNRPATSHITIVLKGSISITFASSGKERLVPAGELIDYASDQEQHMFTALEDGTIVLNIMRGPYTK
jgi:quercetin dioxygenase-like cupin family protein